MVYFCRSNSRKYKEGCKIMDFYLGRSDWKTLQRGEEHSFLLVNGLGGYCSQTVIGSNARHDHNLLTAALVAPTKRFAMVRRIEEILHVGSNAYRLDSQAYVTSSDDAAGFRFLDTHTLCHIFPRRQKKIKKRNGKQIKLNN